MIIFRLMSWVNSHVRFSGPYRSPLKAECYWNTIRSLNIVCSKVLHAAKTENKLESVKHSLLHIVLQLFARSLMMLFIFSLEKVNVMKCVKDQITYTLLNRSLSGVKGEFFRLLTKISKTVAHKEISRTTCPKL